MEKALLMYDTEPTDIQLIELMHEVAVEAKKKATETTKKLEEEIKQLILTAKKKDE